MKIGDITSKAWKSTCKKYPWWKEEMMKEVLTPKTHVVVGQLKKEKASKNYNEKDKN